MIQLQLAEIRAIQLDILKAVAKFCEDNDLVYFLCGGTLLGAVRHEGYIPWDDDIDLMMPREDYERFIQVFNWSGLKLYNFGLSENYNRPFAKISDDSTVLCESTTSNFEIGVNIDIFPLDGFPQEPELREKHIKSITYYRSLLDLKIMKFRKGRAILKELILLFGKVFVFFIPENFIVKKMVNIGKLYRYQSSGDVGIVVWGYGKKEVCAKSIFMSSVPVKFENEFYNAPIGYKSYLKNVYGDYMKLPPVENRVTHHAFTVFKKES